MVSNIENPVLKRKATWVDLLVKLSWIPVTLVVLPISLPLSLPFYLMSYLGDIWSGMQPYKRIKERDPTRDGLVCTARKPWVAIGTRNVDYKRARHFEVDMSMLRNILHIDKERMVAKVEPMVTISQITRVMVPMNLALAVVRGLEELTAGGLINGFGIEGSSHMYGLFSDTVVAYEIVLSDGRIVRATRDNGYQDLFYAIPWSQGTLGLLVEVELKLIPIKEYMRVTYTPVEGCLRDLAQAYTNSFVPVDGDNNKAPDFVETIIYSPSKAVSMVGRYASKEEATRHKRVVINSIGWWFKPWFYQHADGALKRGEFVEFISTREYYHRHTRSFFWEAKLILPFADQWWFRWSLGWLMPPKMSLLKATPSEAIRNYYHDKHVLQDMLVPLHKLADALEFQHHEMEVYPIWLCPHRLFKLPIRPTIYPEPGFERHERQGDTEYVQMYTDVGLYYALGLVLRGEEFNGAEAVHKMEQWLIANHGFEAQYTVSKLSEKDFGRMFDPSLYNLCRAKYKVVGTFVNVYYKSEKGRKTHKEVEEEEQKQVAAQHAELVN